MANTLKLNLVTMQAETEVMSFLQAEGFETEQVVDGAFNERVGPAFNDPTRFVGGIIGDDSPSKGFTHTDYLLATRTDPGPFPSSRVWKIAVTLGPDGKVDEVLTNVRYVK